MRKRLQCFIRMDDITPDMDWDKFNQIREIFEKYNICPLLGVVPDSKDELLTYNQPQEEFWEIIRSLEKQGWAIAQHGMNHCYTTDDSGVLGINSFSEFAGLSYEEQFAKLQIGKNILEENGIHSNIFMAPGHTYDKNTLKALRDCGFIAVTDGLSWKPYISEGLLFVPCRLQTLKKLKGIDTLCLHSNLMTQGDIQELEVFCKNNYKNILPFLPEQIKGYAVKRNIFIAVSEKMNLCIRKIKTSVAGSKRLAWYMNYTNDKSSKKKWIKRLVYLPMLIVGYRKQD